MKSEEVKIWLEKYFEGETTLEEERMLAEFFRRDSVPEELMPYREWFVGLAITDEMSATSAGSARFIVSTDKSAGGSDDDRYTFSVDQFAGGAEDERFTVPADKSAGGTEGERFTVSGDKSLAAGDGQLLTAVDGDSVAAGEGQLFTAAGLVAMIEERERRKRVMVRSLRYTVTGIAASLVVTLGTLFWSQRQPDYRDTFEDPQQALAVAGETLAFVSAKYNKGLEQLVVMQKLTDATRSASKPLSVLNRGFEKADLFRQEEKP